MLPVRNRFSEHAAVGNFALDRAGEGHETWPAGEEVRPRLVGTFTGLCHSAGMRKSGRCGSPANRTPSYLASQSRVAR